MYLKPNYCFIIINYYFDNFSVRYQQGDDEMKRTIAKAWSESKSKGPAF